MKTVGQVLKEARENKALILEDVEKATKIRKELLEALEKSDYSKLPPTTFIQGFIKIYGKYLGLNPDKLLAIFRRDFEAKKHPPVVLESFVKPAQDNKLRFTPAKVLGTAIFVIVAVFFVYLWIEYRQFVGAPNLEVTQPKDGESVQTESVVVAGRTDIETKVKINDQAIDADKSGNFRQEIQLSSSANKIVVTATSKFGQTAKIERTVFLKKESF